MSAENCTLFLSIYSLYLPFTDIGFYFKYCSATKYPPPITNSGKAIEIHIRGHAKILK